MREFKIQSLKDFLLDYFLSKQQCHIIKETDDIRFSRHNMMAFYFKSFKYINIQIKSEITYSICWRGSFESK